MRTAVALGSNLGDRLANLRAARKAVADLAGSAPLCFRLRFTKPARSIANRAPETFLNAVIEFDYEGDPLELLKKLREIEKALGRPLDHVRNTSREIDIDLLYFGDTTIDNQQLQLAASANASEDDLSFNRSPISGRT